VNNPLFEGNEPMSYKTRENNRWLIMFIITATSIAMSLLITFLILYATHNPMLPIIFIIAALAPAIISPITTWSISGLMIKVQKLEEAHRYQATYDDLTGLMSRRAFIEQGEALLNLCERSNEPLTLAFLDLDHFKQVNDVYGHGGGDEVLKVFSKILKHEIRANDLAGRLGGEEFAVLLPYATLEDAKILLERIRQETQNTSVDYLESSIAVTVSGGLASIKNDTCINFSALIKIADDALYNAKANGRNIIV
jgi:diguanylate cyclase (GGDEF)-like protein